MINLRFRIAGLTLLEMVIATSILAFLILGSMTFISSNQDLVTTGYAQASIDIQVQGSVERFTKEIRRAQPDTIIVAADGSSIQFSTIVIDAQGNVQTSNTYKYALVDDPSDPENGKDDDGDGITDEQMFQLEIGDPVTQTTTLTRSVERGVSRFEDDGNTPPSKIKVILTTIKENAATNKLHRSTIQTEVFIHSK